MRTDETQEKIRQLQRLQSAVKELGEALDALGLWSWEEETQVLMNVEMILDRRARLWATTRTLLEEEA